MWLCVICVVKWDMWEYLSWFYFIKYGIQNIIQFLCNAQPGIEPEAILEEGNNVTTTPPGLKMRC